ncbi:MAG: hypothetical protein AAB921_02405 [Patescibacteria group bacterium]
MNAFAIAGALVAVGMYIPLTVNVWNKKLEQNFATFLLWGLLDSIAAGAIFFDGGNFLLPLIYAVLCFGVLIAILRARTFSWSWRESVASAFVIISIVAWFFVSNELATILSTAGLTVASLPQLYDFWKKPQNMPLLTYAGFTAANGLSTIAGADWSIQERLYPASSMIVTIVFVLVGCRKWLPQFREQQPAA